MEVEEVLFDVAEALRVPVLVLALLSLGYVLFEFGGLVAELVRRRRRGMQRLEVGIHNARTALAAGDATRAKLALDAIAANKSMRLVLSAIIDHRTATGGSSRIAKEMAEFDYAAVKRLERTRILVRVGPALGLMGTLIPLSPALAGLAAGDVETLTENLRVAFSVTVAGLLVGAIAFGISLVRDRIYGQDFSDLEYVAASLAPDVPLPPPTQARPTAGARPAPSAPAAPAAGAAATTSPTAPTQPGTAAPPAPPPRPSPGTQT